MPRARFVCPCSLFSADRLVLQSFACLWLAILAKGVRARQQSLTAQRPCARLENLEQRPRFSSLAQVRRRLFDFSELLRPFGMPRAELVTYCNRLAIAPRAASKPHGAKVLYRFVNLVALHNGRANGIRIVIHTREDDGTGGGCSEFALGPITAGNVAVLVLVGGF